MPNKHRELVVQFSQITDALVIALVFWLAHAFREELAYRLPEHFTMIHPFRYYKWLYLVILPLYPILLDVNGFYKRPHPMRPLETLWILAKSVVICALVVIAVMYFFRFNVVSRGVIMLFAAFSVGALFVKDLLFQLYLRASVRSHKFTRSVLLVGPPEKNADFEAFIEQPRLGCVFKTVWNHDDINIPIIYHNFLYI